MVIYICKCCNFKTSHKGNYERHLETKKHKKSTISQHLVNKKSTLVNKKSTIVCKYCEKGFTTKQAMYRHIKYTCKKSKDEDLKELVKLMNEDLQQELNEIKKVNNKIITENKKIKKEIEKRDKQITKLTNKLQIKNLKNIQNNIKNNIQNNNNNNNNIQNNQINIHLNNYKDTDISLLNEVDFINCINRCKNCVVQAIETIHFNPKFPQNMNLCISNIKENYMLMYEDQFVEIKR